MLSLHALRSASGGGAAEIYEYLTESDYYTEEQTVTGMWHGAGCEDFSLTAGGAVNAKEFQNLLRGYDKGGNVFTRGAPPENHMAGLDLTFSSPKSVSMLRAISNDPERATIDKILLEARTKALDYMVEQGAFRLRTAGNPPAKPVFAMFSHHSSREQDMQEHYHVVAFNAAMGPEHGHTIEMSDIFRRKLEFGAVMRAFEAKALQRAGYTIERDGTSYRVMMFTKEAERHFSKGAEKIKAAVGENASARAKDAAAIKVRNEKISEEPSVADRRRKDELFAVTGLDGDMTAALIGKPMKLSSEANRPRYDKTDIIDRMSSQAAYFRETDFRGAIAQAAVGCFDGDEINGLINDAKADDRLVPLYSTEEAEGAWMHQAGGFEALSDQLKRQAERSYEKWRFEKPELAAKYGINDYVSFTQEQRAADPNEAEKEAVPRKQLGWTTRETIMADMELARYTKTASQSRKHGLNQEIVDKSVTDFEALKAKEIPGFKISEQQRGAIYHMTTQGDLAIVEGVAGAGKSTFLFPVARAHQACGYRVFGLSAQNTNAQDLAKDAEIETYTIDKFLGLTKPGPRRLGEERLEIDANTVIIIDEAGQVGGAKMHQVQRVVEAAGAKLLLSGHTAQKQAIAGTAAMKLMRDVAGEGGSAWITETQRQRDKAHGEALTQLSEGDAAEALVTHAKAGRFHVVEREGTKEAAAAYHRHVEAVGVDKAFVLCDRNATMREVNNEIRANLKRAGVVAARDFTVTLADKARNRYESQLSVGDRIITRTKVKGEKAIQNGIVWTIADLHEIEPGRLKIGMVRADGKPVDETGRERVEIDTQKTKNFHLSYAMTTDLSQGKTKEAGGIMITDANRAEITQWYVSTSRFKEVPDIIVSDFAIKEMALMQGRHIDNPHDIAEAAAVLVAAAEDASHKKTHTLDKAYALPEGFQPDRAVDAKLVAQREQREQKRIEAEKAGEAADYDRINAETAKRARENRQKAQGRDDAAPLSADGKLPEDQRGKLALEGEGALTKTPEQIAAQEAAFRAAKSPENIHALRAAEKAAAKQAKPAAQQPARPQEQDQAVQPESAPVRRSLLEMAKEAKASAQQHHAAELAAKADRARREQGRQRIGALLNRAEMDWRRLPQDAPAEQIEQAHQARQEAREAYRGLLPIEAERKRWDARNTQIDLQDAHTPASKRMAEIEAERATQAAQEGARRRAEAARQKGPGLSL